MTQQRRFNMNGHSDNTDTDDGMEKSHHQGHLRIMERDQQIYKTQACEQIQKQEQEIENLLKEQDELHQSLAAHMSFFQQCKDSEVTEELQALLEQSNKQEVEMEDEKQCQDQLHMEILSMESRLADMKKDGFSSRQSQSLKARRTIKAMRILEGSLNRAYINYCNLMTQNNQLKEELDTLCVERENFYKLRNNLTKEEQKISESTDEMLKLYKAASELKEKDLAEKKMLSEKAVKDLVQYETELEEIERGNAHKFNLENFIRTKFSEEAGQFHDKMESEQVSDMKEEMNLNLGEPSLDKLNEIGEELLTVVEMNNPDLQVNICTKGDYQTVDLLKFVNEQNTEAEKLKDHINKIKEEMAKFHQEALQSEQKRHSSLKDVEQKIEETRSQAETYKNQDGLLCKILDKVKTVVHSISETGCDRSAVEEKLGFSSEITENNIMTYLDLIKEKTNELTLQTFFLPKENGSSPTDLAQGLQDQDPEPLKQVFNTLPSVSSLELDEEEFPVTSEDERPLSQECLRRKILKHSSALRRSSRSPNDQHQA